MHEAEEFWDEWVGRNGSTEWLHGLQPHLQCDACGSREAEADYRGDYQGASCGVEVGEWVSSAEMDAQGAGGKGMRTALDEQGADKDFSMTLDNFFLRAILGEGVSCFLSHLG